jgi:hypothetical protein
MDTNVQISPIQPSDNPIALPCSRCHGTTQHRTVAGLERQSLLLTGSNDDPSSSIDEQIQEQWLLTTCLGCNAVALARRVYDLGSLCPSFEGEYVPSEIEIAYDEQASQSPADEPDSRSVEAVAQLLRNASHALNRWTWETDPRVKNGTARQWHIDHEYHVQNLVWTLLSPTYTGLLKEVEAGMTGRRRGRADLAIPRLRLAIEIKFWYPDESQQELIEELAKARSLYLARNTAYDHLLCFIWDEQRRSEQHEEIRQGMENIRITETIIIPRPGSWT